MSAGHRETSEIGELMTLSQQPSSTLVVSMVGILTAIHGMAGACVISKSWMQL